MRIGILTARLLAAGVVTCAGLLPSFSSAMMLGGIVLHSNLGQPLRATVSVRAEAGEQLDGSCFSLARPEQQDDFTYLTQARLTLEEVNGRLQLGIRSQQSIDEPFIRLLLRADCGQGRVNRTFTVLLDPEELASPPLPVVAQNISSDRKTTTQVNVAKSPDARQRETSQSIAPRKQRKSRKTRVPIQAISATPTAELSEKSLPRATSPSDEGTFRLKLSSEELDLSALGKITEEQRQHLREKQRLLDADDQVANTLSMKNRIMQLESEIGEMQLALAKTNKHLAMSQQLPVAPVNKPVQNAPGMLDKFYGGLENLSLRGFAGVGLILALLLSVWWRWRRRQAESWLENELSQEFPADVPHVTTQPTYGKKASVATTPTTDIIHEDELYHGPTSIFGPETETVTFTEAESVLDEADLYLAYGWANRAIELLQGYLEKHPDDVQLWKKLFETYSTQEMKQEFEQLALRCQATMDDSSLWVLVQKLGRQLDAENPLYLSSLETQEENPVDTPPSEPERPALDKPLEFVLDDKVPEVKEAQPEVEDPLFPDLFETPKKDGENGSATKKLSQ